MGFTLPLLITLSNGIYEDWYYILTLMIDAIISAHFQLNPHPVILIDNKVVDFFIGTDKTTKNLIILLKLIYKKIANKLTSWPTSKKSTYIGDFCKPELTNSEFH